MKRQALIQIKKENPFPQESPLAVITGASSGIGAATAWRLARGGYRVALVARRADRLEGLAKEINLACRSNPGAATPITADLGQEAGRVQVFEQVERECGPAEVLVNNAGMGWYGFAGEMTWQTASEILHLNVEAAVHLSLLFLQGMQQRNAGHVINIGSISGALPSQGIAVYGATKAFLDNFTTALVRELRGTRVHASVVRAGPVITEFCDTAAVQENGQPVPTRHVGVTAEHVAGRIWGLLKRPRRVIYIPRTLAVVPWLELVFGGLIDAIGPLLLKHPR